MMFDVYTIDPYGSVLIVGVNNDPYKIATKLNILTQGLDLDYPVDQSVAAITFERFIHLPGTRGTKQYLIVLIHEAYADIATIAHETVHVVNYIFKATGVHLDVDNDEAQAYLTGTVAAKMQETVDKYKKRKRK